MIRRLLIGAAALALPATVLTGITSVGGAGVAGAAKT